MDFHLEGMINSSNDGLHGTVVCVTALGSRGHGFDNRGVYSTEAPISVQPTLGKGKLYPTSFHKKPHANKSANE